MMDRVDSTPARRLAVRGALSLSNLLPILFVACVVHAESGGSTTVSCPPDEKTKFACGVLNSEDIVQLPKTHWVISSGKIGPGVPVGHLYLINANTRAVETVLPRGTEPVSTRSEAVRQLSWQAGRDEISC